ncbi:MAG: PadR family transcriptional regulator [Gemmatimonadales bacterium]
MPTDPQRFLPLRPVELLVLVALAEQEQHGYGLTQSIADRTGGTVRLEPGNLYKVLKRLVGDGLIVAGNPRQVAELDNERRRYYRLTRLGARVAVAEAERLRALVATPALRALVRELGAT